MAERVMTLSRLGSEFTVSTRVQDAKWAIEDWKQSPVFGRGTGSFVQIHGVRVGTEAWVSNLILHTLLDTGIVGLVIQMSLFILVAARTWNAARITKDPALAVGLRGLTLGFVVMMVAYQVTDGTWLAVFWVHLGLMVNGIYCVDKEVRA
jgi:O-antigen ligase